MIAVQATCSQMTRVEMARGQRLAKCVRPATDSIELILVGETRDLCRVHSAAIVRSGSYQGSAISSDWAIVKTVSK